MISGVVLAAGTSSRLGRPKQLLDLGGKPVIQHVVDAALGSPLEDVVVVVGHVDQLVVAALPRDDRVRTVFNHRFPEGQSTSLVAGLSALDPACEAAVILLGDQPGVRTEAIAAVVDAFASGAGPVVQAAYGGRRAHPTLLSRPVWADVMAEAKADEGARSILASHPEWVRVAELGGLPPDDIDTEDDYRRILAVFHDSN